MLRLAHEAGLTGWIQNRSDSVRIVLEGSGKDIELFMREFGGQLPPNAVVSSVSLVESIEVPDQQKAETFSIMPSSETDSHSLLIPADLAICPDCMVEITDPSDRRYGYAFTTCVNCGPRYTVINATPYDRERTTLSAFPMCAQCSAEYGNPSDRRFHAETIACHACGPKLSMTDISGRPVDGDPLRAARMELSQGKIVAVRGIGGFLLAADAMNRHTLKTLRKRKNRPHKPFAVMASTVDVLRRYCMVTSEGEKLLLSPESPIVIMSIKPEAITSGLLTADLITPDSMTMGVMLPTSPLHKLLLEPLEGDNVPPFELLIMTSGNRGGEPICLTDSEVHDRLGNIADFILTHNREINLRNDDSLCVIRQGKAQVWRRARGFAPNPIQLLSALSRNVLAMGADMKNTITVAYNNCAVISPHIGDLETPEALDSIENVAQCLPAFLKKIPESVAVDLHPDMHSSKLGRKIALKSNLPVIEIQHHHAHAAACLEENGQDKGLALVFDGTGLGTDGSIWGAELLYVDENSFRRLGTFAGVPLPGGDAAVRHPARQLVSRFVSSGTGISPEWCARLGIPETDVALWTRQCLEGINAPVTHAAGRLFDSFSVLLGFAPADITYEGQPAIRLEAAALKHIDSGIPDLPFSVCEQGGKLVIDWSASFSMMADLKLIKGRETAFAMAVHYSVAKAALRMVEYALNIMPIRTIALSGGVFMNGILNDLLAGKLETMGLKVLRHRYTPPNDGCISFGQAVVAGRK